MALVFSMDVAQRQQMMIATEMTEIIFGEQQKRLTKLEERARQVDQLQLRSLRLSQKPRRTK